MPALGRLIDRELAAQNLSLREVGRRAGISSSRMSQLRTDEFKTLPTRDTLERLARALMLPTAVVLDAALETLGLARVATEDPELSIIRAGLDELPEEDRVKLVKQIRALIAVQKYE